MLIYDSLYDVRIYIGIPIMEGYVAIPSAEDCTVIASTEDCFMITLFASSILLNVLPYTFDLRICFVPQQ